VTLAFFVDAGVNRITFRNKLKLNPDRIIDLNGEFPSAAFENNAVLVPGSQRPRSSTGAELQIMMPVVNAPFRLYWAYNLDTLTTTLRAPITLDPAMFPNQATYLSAAQTFGSQAPYEERHSLFRFTISRTF
jgi:outer membrane protein insertion porin family